MHVPASPAISALSMSIVENRKAFHDYFIEERFEAGIALEGWEAKSIRAGRANLKEAYVVVKGGELFLIGAHLSPQIIPTDDTPGAREARVVYFIDKSLATWARDQRPPFRRAVAELRKRARVHGAASFAALTEAQQHGVIAALEKDRHQAFQTMRGATIAGMLSNPEYGGNHEKSGWKLIGFNDQFSWAPPFGWYDANVR
jgi:hypothetical protein